MILALLQNGLRRAVTRISGDPATLRDYVFARDVGALIASEVLGCGNSLASGGIRLLAAGKPSSLREICGMVEGLLGRKVYVAYERGPQNALHNTYCPSASALAGCATGLKEGIHQVFLRLTSGAALLQR